jgi:large subunit ribosomal protein L29
MKAVELRDFDLEGLRAKEQELDDQLFRMRIKKALGQLEAPGKIKDVRRDLARIKTILKERAK